MPVPSAPAVDTLPFARRAAIVAVAVALNGVLYLAINAHTAVTAPAMQASALDAAVGRHAWAIWPYWLLLLLAPAMALAIPDRRLFAATLRAYVAALAVNAAAWLALPTRLPRAPLPADLDPGTAWAWHALLALDGTANCFPSGHVTLPLVIAAGFAMQHPRAGRAAFALIALLAPSVIATGQHVALDVAGGSATALLGLLATGHPSVRGLRRGRQARDAHGGNA